MKVSIASNIFNKLISNFPSAVAIGCGLSGGEIGSSCLLFCLGALGLLTQELIDDIQQGKDIDTIRKHVEDAFESLKQQHEGIELIADFIAIEKDINIDHLGYHDSRSPYLIIHRFIQGEFDHLTEEVQSIVKSQTDLKEELNESQKRQLQLLTVCREIAKTNPKIEQIEKQSEENLALQKQLVAKSLSYFDDSDAFFELTLDELNQLSERFNTLLTEIQKQNATLLPLDFRIYPNYAHDHKNNDQNIFRFHYQSRRTQLLGRDQELKELLQFLEPDTSKPFDLKWWLWTGPGGLGKSRLALELCLEAHSKGYHAGFLPTDSTGEINKESFQQPHLIIIDYTILRPDIASKLIMQIDTHKSSVSAPIRILILERSADNDLDRWFQSFRFPEINTNRHLVESFKYDDPRELSPLSNNALWKLMCSIFDEDKKKYNCHQSKILETLNLIDPQKRPLFAMMTADAISSSATDDLKSMRHWDQSILSDMILNKEFGRWKKSQLDDRLLNNVFFSTITGAQSYKLFDDINQSISEEEQLLISGEELDTQDLQQVFCFSQTIREEQVFSYEPDILGEYFVLQRLLADLRIDDKRTIKSKNEAYQLLKLAWCRFPLNTASFLLRTADDFPDHPAKELIAKLSNEQCTDKSFLTSLAFFRRGLSFHIFELYGSAIKDYTQGIDEYSGAPLDQIAMALLNRGLCYNNQGEWELAKDDFTRVIDQLPEASVNRVAQALIHRGYGYDKQGEWELAKDDYTQVIDQLTGTPIYQVARALVHRGHNHDDQGEWELAKDDYTRVIDQLTGASVDWIAQALVQRGISYNKQGEWELAKDDYTQVIDQLTGTPIYQVARALVHRGHNHDDQGEWELAKDDYTRVIDQLTGAPVDWIAQALIHRGHNHDDQDEWELAKDDYTRVIDQLTGAPVDDIAQALVLRGYGYDKQGEWELAKNDYTRVIDQLTEAPVDWIAQALVHRGYGYDKQGEWKLAKDDFRRALSMNALDQDKQQNTKQFLTKLECKMNN
ncbi:tetratricopeptide repeat protein [Gimesia aquarii]|uniref:Lipoprotein NlpI n=1 Tax=Gimesia aquarii TaxID=2527964 RepID=A0A517VTE4_9PLAN|nr:tetratricopeptide repeat protein [Gimesia aquarii]QDT96281.1 lipoprotein NlpI [Gimesia aquarii]